jgi:YVTN family beta-propeller protein
LIDDPVPRIIIQRQNGAMMTQYGNLRRPEALILAGMLAAAGVMHAQTDTEPRGRTIHPHAVAVNPATHRIYAVDQGRDRVVVIGPDGQTTIAVGRQPNAIAIDPAMNRIYVVNAGSGNVSVIDGGENRVITTLPTDTRPYAIGIDAGLHRVFATNTFSDKVTAIDGTTNTAKQLPLGSKDFVETDTRRHRAFFISYEDPALTVVDADESAHRVKLGLSHPWGLAVDEQRGIVYVTEIGKDTLVAYHEETGKTETAPTGSMPDAIAIDEGANRIYVANYVGDSVTVLDGATLKPVATVVAGHHPQALAVDGRRHRVFVANTHSNNVTVIDGVSNRVLATLPGGMNPYAIAVDPGSGAAYAANYGSHPVTKLDLSKLRSGSGN